MKRAPYAIFFLFFLLVRFSSGEPREKKTFQPFLRYSYFSGFRDYEIEGVDGDGKWRSDLDFPVNNMRLDCGLALCTDSFTFTIEGWRTFDRDAGTMTDDDWSAGVRDIWSRSDAELTAFGGTVDATYWAVDTEFLSIGPKLGFNFSYFDYDIYDVVQWGEEVSVDGKVLEYERGEVVLYPGLEAVVRPLPSLDIGLDFHVTPLSYIWDEDDHILRDKLSEGEAMSWYFSAGLEACYMVWKSDAAWLRIGLHGRYSYMTSWYGSQDQRFYGGENEGVRYSDVTYSAKSEAFLVGAKLSMGF